MNVCTCLLKCETTQKCGQNMERSEPLLTYSARYILNVEVVPTNTYLQISALLSEVSESVDSSTQIFTRQSPLASSPRTPPCTVFSFCVLMTANMDFKVSRGRKAHYTCVYLTKIENVLCLRYIPLTLFSPNVQFLQKQVCIANE